MNLNKIIDGKIESVFVNYPQITHDTKYVCVGRELSMNVHEFNPSNFEGYYVISDGKWRLVFDNVLDATVCQSRINMRGFSR